MSQYSILWKVSLVYNYVGKSLILSKLKLASSRYVAPLAFNKSSSGCWRARSTKILQHLLNTERNICVCFCAYTSYSLSVLHEAAGTFANITPPFESITKSKTGLFPHTQGFSVIYAQYTQCFEDVYTYPSAHSSYASLCPYQKCNKDFRWWVTMSWSVGWHIF